MIEAILYTRNTSSPKVKCQLCPHFCQIANNRTGICHTRKNINGTLYALNYGKLVAARPDPIEKKPLYHFYPGHASYSISSVGCNLACANCQNHTISQQDISHIDIADTTPQEVISAALHSGCNSISYTYTEPTTMVEFILATAKLTPKHNLKNVMVSNGYMSDQGIDLLLPHVQAINIDLKSFSDSFYRKFCHATLPPILNTIKRFYTAGVHIEITTLIIPELNDSPEELHQIGTFIHDLNPEIPWHISRFHPAYKLNAIPITPNGTLIGARDIGQDIGLHHVYIGNAPEIPSHTHCHNCQTILFTRSTFTTTRQSFTNGRCQKCQTKLFGKFY